MLHHRHDVSIHSRLLSRELPWYSPPTSSSLAGFNPLPVIKPGVTAHGPPYRGGRCVVSIHSRLLSRELPVEPFPLMFTPRVSIHSRLLSRELRLCCCCL
ncbi:protein of unknown function [Methylocaldum szegediense]|uniref:Uncharacterized protein n=1 Tax=Methylocaldum szegediense TaxID=73780 RepID=A0ABM9I951_9GAMM|nr:protein of unknown function [Methylocaldum szegediense]